MVTTYRRPEVMVYVGRITDSGKTHFISSLFTGCDTCHAIA